MLFYIPVKKINRHIETAELAVRKCRTYEQIHLVV